MEHLVWLQWEIMHSITATWCAGREVLGGDSQRGASPSPKRKKNWGGGLCEEILGREERLTMDCKVNKEINFKKENIHELKWCWKKCSTKTLYHSSKANMCTSGRILKFVYYAKITVCGLLRTVCVTIVMSHWFSCWQNRIVLMSLFFLAKPRAPENTPS